MAYCPAGDKGVALVSQLAVPVVASARVSAPKNPVTDPENVGKVSPTVTVAGLAI